MMSPEEKQAWRESVAVRQLKRDEFADYARQSPKHAAQARAEIQRRVAKFADSFSAVLREIDDAAHVAEGDCASTSPSKH